MSKQVAEQTVTEDKSLADMSVEELKNAYDSELSGQSEESDPVDEVELDAPEAEIESKDPKDSEDSSVLNSEESKDEKYEQLSKQMEGLQKLISKFGNEIGEVRKFKDSLQKESQSNKSNEDEDDPYVAEMVEKKLRANEERQRAEQERLNTTKSYLENKLPGFNGMVDKMADNLREVLADEPEVDNYVSNFKENPYSVDPLTLLYMGRNAVLQNEINELKAKVSNSGSSKRDLINKVNNLGSSKGVVSNGSNASSSGAKGGFTARQIESMTVEELQKAYRQETEDL